MSRCPTLARVAADRPPGGYARRVPLDERAPFLFAVCQVGAERVLKEEVLREHPALRFAYSRPGLVTWKDPSGPVAPEVALRAIFARAWGASFGSPSDDAELAAVIHRLAVAQPVRLHVFARDRYRPGEAPPEDAADEQAASVGARLRAQCPTAIAPGDEARPGELVVDVIVPPAGEPLLMGAHRHVAGRVPWPGGRIAVTVPADAPSRAFRKLEEALAWSRAPIRPGDVALEIGSSPGGAALALVGRGVSVVGVDSGVMAPHVLARVGPNGARVTHVPVAVAKLRREQLPPRVEWLLLDVNLAPQVALHQVRRLVPPLRSALTGVIFTLKLNDWGMASELPSLLARIREFGMVELAATQLPSNRQEVCVVGLTARGVARRRVAQRGPRA